VINQAYSAEDDAVGFAALRDGSQRSTNWLAAGYIVASPTLRLPVGDGTIWTEVCLCARGHGFCDLGDLGQLLEVQLCA
jgi:hypothetical protein